MKKIKLFLILLVFANNSLAQKELDSLNTNEGLSLVNIVEITDNEIKFKLPNEELVNTVSKNTVRTIRLKSGRLINFTQKYKLVSGGKDWKNVIITYSENDTKGLFRQGEPISNQYYGGEVSVKMQTAMLGGNIVHISNERSTLDRSLWTGQYYQETIYSGGMYSNRKVNISDLQKFFGDKLDFDLVKKEVYQCGSEKGIEVPEFYKHRVYFENIREQKGGVYIDAKIPKKSNIDSFKIIYLDEKKIVLMWTNGCRILNYTLSPF